MKSFFKVKKNIPYSGKKWFFWIESCQNSVSAPISKDIEYIFCFINFKQNMRQFGLKQGIYEHNSLPGTYTKFVIYLTCQNSLAS